MGLRHYTLPSRRKIKDWVRSDVEKVAYFKESGFHSFNETEMRLAHLKFLHNCEAERKAENALALKVLPKPAKELVEYDTFKESILGLADKVDKRIYILGSSFFITGLSIGIIIPILPILVKQMQLSPTQFSVVVSAFAVSKLISGIPSGSYAETYGRKKVIVFGTVVCGIGIGLYGWTLAPLLSTMGLSLTWLVGARLLTGMGHSFFSSGALMYVSDISNSRNRARSMVPISTSIHAGLMLGPVIGGVMVEYMGIQSTYFAVGCTVLGIAAINRFILTETYKPEVRPSKQINSFKKAFLSWKKLMKRAEIRDTLFLNLSYWITLAGAQFTLLPLHMVSEQLNLGPKQIGFSFAAMSVVTVLAAQPFAFIADKYGTKRMLVFGSLLLSSSMVVLANAHSFQTLLMALVPMAMGSTILSSLPLAFLSDIVKEHERPQAISLLRFVGDVGFLMGATFSGMLSQFTSIGLTLQSNTIFILSGITVFFIRRKLRVK